MLNEKLAFGAPTAAALGALAEGADEATLDKDGPNEKVLAAVDDPGAAAAAVSENVGALAGPACGWLPSVFVFCGPAAVLPDTAPNENDTVLAAPACVEPPSAPVAPPNADEAGAESCGAPCVPAAMPPKLSDADAAEAFVFGGPNRGAAAVDAAAAAPAAAALAGAVLA